MINKIFVAVLFVISFIEIKGQTITNWLPPMNTVSPEAFRFLKYGEIPVNEYTGIANISIPIYTIKLKNLELPIVLSYHGGGNRVSEEASWVGLGWDIQLGSVVQIVNGADDFDIYPMNMPDYIYGCISTPDIEAGLYDSRLNYNISATYPYFSFIRFRDNLMPQSPSNTNIDDYFYTGQKDCAPDVMKANFFGHSIQFIKDPKSSNFIILNKLGYVIQSTTLSNGNFGWKITVPDGTQFYFEEVSTTISSGNSNPIANLGGYSNNFSSGGPTPNSIGWTSNVTTKSRCWQISKIISTKNETITFNYNYSSPSNKTDYGYSSEWQVYTASVIYNFSPPMGDMGPIVDGATRITGSINDLVYISQSTSNSLSYYLSNIDFPNGNISFSISDRTDYGGAKKLDNVSIFNKPNLGLINSFSFNYSYFDANLSGLGFVCPKSSNELNQRLKLNSVTEMGTPPYLFVYNPELLPPKNSFAIDYWGFYNGKLSNTSMLPNVLRMKSDPDPAFYTTLNKNTNNNASSLLYTKAGILEQITYPTGGRSIFEYELNTFSNLIVADYNYIPSATTNFPNTYSTGQGLRIKAVTNWIGTEITGRTLYNYQGGRTMIPQKYFRHYTDHEMYIDPSHLYQITLNTYSNFKVQSGNQYRSNELGSGNYVGYDAVTIIEQPVSLSTNGKKIKYFTNNEDYIQRFTDRYKVSLPSQKNEIENGLILKEETYKNDNTLLLKRENKYHSILNPALYIGTPTIPKYYGAQFESTGVYSNLMIYDDFGIPSFVNKYRTDLAAYYPLMLYETLLDSTITTNIENGQSICQRQAYEYTSNNFVRRAKTKTSKNQYLITNNIYPDDNLSIVDFTTDEQNNIRLLKSANRLTEKVLVSNYLDATFLKEDKIPYKQSGSYVVAASVNSRNGTSASYSDIIYDQYDSYGNVSQFTEKNGITTSCIWGYNGAYLVAKIVGKTINEIGLAVILEIGSHPFSNSTTYASIKNDADYLKGQLNSLMNASNVIVTLYTYAPLIGMTSQTDPTSITTYYEYDNLNRQKHILDYNASILKEYDYNLFQSSPATYYYNDVLSSFFYKPGCPAGYTPAPYLYTVDANIYCADSKQNANILAQNDLATNGQNAANANGSCNSNTSGIYYINPGSTSLLYEIAGGNQTVTISSNATYTVSSSSPWISVSPTTLTGNGTIYINCIANCCSARSGAITLKSTGSTGSITCVIIINQKGQTSYIAANPNSLIFLSIPVVQNATITSSSPWNISSVTGSFFTATKINETTLQVNCVDNPRPIERYGTIKITNGINEAIINISQWSSSGPPNRPQVVD